MGREIRRVPLSFDWPLGTVWKGFESPEWRKCPDCDHGYSEAYMQIEQGVTELLDQVMTRHPNPLVAQVTTYLAGRSPAGALGHDAIDRWNTVAKLAELAGLPKGWDTCVTCRGSAIHPEDEKASEEWVATPPPKGEGWQMWETVSDGSPLTPVFGTSEELVKYLVTKGDFWISKLQDGPKTWTREAAQRLVKDKYVPSLVVL